MKKKLALLLLALLLLPVLCNAVLQGERYTISFTSPITSSTTSIDYYIPGKNRVINTAFYDGDAGGYYKDLIGKKGMTRVQALDFLAPALPSKIYALCEEQGYAAINARVRFNPDAEEKFTYSSEKAGRKIDFEGALDDAARILSGGGTVMLKAKRIAPEITLERAKAATQKIAEFSTVYTGSAEGRKQNVALAAMRFSGLAVGAGERLSFNAVAKKRTEENGYKTAKVIENGEYIEGIGGGVCQVSTTLYNTWLYAGLRVYKSQSHSLPAKYVPEGCDATVSDYIDMVLENDSGYPVYVAAQADGQRVRFTLYGKPRGYEIKLQNDLITKTPIPETPKREGEGDTLIDKKDGSEGAIYKSYQCFYKNGVLVKKVKIRLSGYAPRPNVEIYGTPEEPAVEE